jgi:uncharacterized membrane protein HdeD (DUF308 family)
MNGWIFWLVAGLASLAGGLFALANPLAATLTSVLLTGYLFMAVGVLMLISIFSDTTWTSRLLSLLLGLAVLFVGISIVSNPLRGVLSLTVLVAIMMLVIGVLRIVYAFGLPTPTLKGLLILSGIVSVVLGLMILSNFPYSAAVVLGILLAIELISNGISLIALALARKSAPSVARS